MDDPDVSPDDDGDASVEGQGHVSKTPTLHGEQAGARGLKHWNQETDQGRGDARKLADMRAAVSRSAVPKRDGMPEDSSRVSSLPRLRQPSSTLDVISSANRTAIVGVKRTQVPNEDGRGKDRGIEGDQKIEQCDLPADEEPGASSIRLKEPLGVRPSTQTVPQQRQTRSACAPSPQPDALEREKQLLNIPSPRKTEQSQAWKNFFGDGDFGRDKSSPHPRQASPDEHSAEDSSTTPFVIRAGRTVLRRYLEHDQNLSSHMGAQAISERETSTPSDIGRFAQTARFLHENDAFAQDHAIPVIDEVCGEMELDETPWIESMESDDSGDEDLSSERHSLPLLAWTHVVSMQDTPTNLSCSRCGHVQAADSSDVCVVCGHFRSQADPQPGTPVLRPGRAMSAARRARENGANAHNNVTSVSVGFHHGASPLRRQCKRSHQQKGMLVAVKTEDKGTQEKDEEEEAKKGSSEGGMCPQRQTQGAMKVKAAAGVAAPRRNPSASAGREELWQERIATRLGLAHMIDQQGKEITESAMLVKGGSAGVPGKTKVRPASRVSETTAKGGKRPKEKKPRPGDPSSLRLLDPEREVREAGSRLGFSDGLSRLTSGVSGVRLKPLKALGGKQLPPLKSGPVRKDYLELLMLYDRAREGASPNRDRPPHGASPAGVVPSVMSGTGLSLRPSSSIQDVDGTESTALGLSLIARLGSEHGPESLSDFGNVPGAPSRSGVSTIIQRPPSRSQSFYSSHTPDHLSAREDSLSGAGSSLRTSGTDLRSVARTSGHLSVDPSLSINSFHDFSPSRTSSGVALGQTLQPWSQTLSDDGRTSGKRRSRPSGLLDEAVAQATDRRLLDSDNKSSQKQGGRLSSMSSYTEGSESCGGESEFSAGSGNLNPLLGSIGRDDSTLNLQEPFPHDSVSRGGRRPGSSLKKLREILPGNGPDQKARARVATRQGNSGDPPCRRAKVRKEKEKKSAGGDWERKMEMYDPHVRPFFPEHPSWQQQRQRQQYDLAVGAHAVQTASSAHGRDHTGHNSCHPASPLMHDMDRPMLRGRKASVETLHGSSVGTWEVSTETPASAFRLPHPPPGSTCSQATRGLETMAEVADNSLEYRNRVAEWMARYQTHYGAFVDSEYSDDDFSSDDFDPVFLRVPPNSLNGSCSESDEGWDGGASPPTGVSPNAASLLHPKTGLPSQNGSHLSLKSGTVDDVDATRRKLHKKDCPSTSSSCIRSRTRSQQDLSDGLFERTSPNCSFLHTLLDSSRTEDYTSYLQSRSRGWQHSKNDIGIIDLEHYGGEEEDSSSLMYDQPRLLSAVAFASARAARGEPCDAMEQETLDQHALESTCEDISPPSSRKVSVATCSDQKRVRSPKHEREHLSPHLLYKLKQRRDKKRTTRLSKLWHRLHAFQRSTIRRKSEAKMSVPAVQVGSRKVRFSEGTAPSTSMVGLSGSDCDPDMSGGSSNDEKPYRDEQPHAEGRHVFEECDREPHSRLQETQTDDRRCSRDENLLSDEMQRPDNHSTQYRFRYKMATESHSSSLEAKSPKSSQDLEACDRTGLAGSLGSLLEHCKENNDDDSGEVFCGGGDNITADRDVETDYDVTQENADFLPRQDQPQVRHNGASVVSLTPPDQQSALKLSTSTGLPPVTARATTFSLTSQSLPTSCRVRTGEMHHPSYDRANHKRKAMGPTIDGGRENKTRGHATYEQFESVSGEDSRDEVDEESRPVHFQADRSHVIQSRTVSTPRDAVGKGTAAQAGRECLWNDKRERVWPKADGGGSSSRTPHGDLQMMPSAATKESETSSSAPQPHHPGCQAGADRSTSPGKHQEQQRQTKDPNVHEPHIRQQEQRRPERQRGQQHPLEQPFRPPDNHPPQPHQRRQHRQDQQHENTPSLQYSHQPEQQDEHQLQEQEDQQDDQEEIQELDVEHLLRRRRPPES